MGCGPSLARVSPRPYQPTPPNLSLHEGGPGSLHSLTLLWDCENLQVPKSKEFTAGDLSDAMVEVAFVAACKASGCIGGECKSKLLVCVHPARYPLPLMNSLRTRGVQMLDAGTKRGAVDTHLKGYMNDLVVNTLLAGGGPGVAGMGERWIFVVSGDADFAMDARRARKGGFKVGIIYAPNSNSDFTLQADCSVPWSDVLEAARLKKSLVGSTAAVTGTPSTEAPPTPSAQSALSSPSTSDEPGQSDSGDSTQQQVGAAGAGAGAGKAGAASAVAATPTSPQAASNTAAVFLPSTPSSSSSPTPLTTNTLGKERPPCRYYNSSEGCHRARCRFPHVPFSSSKRVAEP
jgi:hypothetical protein